MIEEQFQGVHQFVCGHVTAGIPKTTFEWIFVVEGFALIEHFTPCHFLAVGTGDIENWNLNRSTNDTDNDKSTFQLIVSCVEEINLQWPNDNLLLFGGCNFISNCDQSVDGNINRNDFGTEFTVTQHSTDDTLSTTNHNTNWSVQTVHPSLAWLFPSRRHWKNIE